MSDTGHTTEFEADPVPPEAIARVLGALPDAVIVFDEDGTIRWWNDQVRAATGYTDEEIEELEPLKFVPADQRARLAEAVARVMAEGGVQTQESSLTTKGGEQIPTEFKGARITNDDGDPIAYVGIGRDITERKRAETELRNERNRFIAVFDSTPEPVIHVVYEDDEPIIRRVNPAFESTFGYDAETAVGASLNALIVPDDLLVEAQRLDRRVTEQQALEQEVRRQTADGIRDFLLRVAPLRFTETTSEMIATYADITEQKAHQRQLARQRDELDTLNRINALIQAVIEELTEAPSREDVERIVCDRLASSDLYRMAWIGSFDGANDRVRHRVGAGFDGEYFERLASIGPDDAGGRPAAAAVRTGETQVVADMHTEPRVDERVRRFVLESGINSIVVTPLSYGGTVYGFLAVGVTRSNALSERECAAFEMLGDAIGFAINAIRNRRLLLADTVIELEFRTADTVVFANAASTKLQCAIELDGMVPLGNEALLCYFSVAGASPSALLDLVEDASALGGGRVLADHGDAGSIEVAVSGSSLVLGLVKRGANVHSASSNRGQGHVIAEISPETDVRDLVGWVRSEFPDTELVGKRPNRGPVSTLQNVHEPFDTQLTDKQRAALQTAYLGGYYEWPRRSTAEELADALDIASSTLHRHLRKAHHKLLSAVFDTRSPESNGRT